MLVLTRKAQESVVIGAEPGAPQPLLTITVLGIDGGNVRLGFEADAGVPVHRLEVWQRIHAGSLPAGSVPGPLAGPAAPGPTLNHLPQAKAGGP
jgi:carbon storage regulator